jgi:uncharacterized protein (TIGR00251 family)
MLEFKASADAVSFAVRVTPRASRSAIRGESEGVLKVCLTAPPVEGAANAALCTYLAEILDVPRRAVEISYGHQGRLKTVRVSGLDGAALLERLARVLG